MTLTMWGTMLILTTPNPVLITTTGPLLPKKDDIKDHTRGNHDEGKTKYYQRDCLQVHCQGGTLNWGRYEVLSYQRDDIRTVRKCIHITNYTGGRETRACWTHHGGHALWKPFVEILGNATILCSRDDCSDDSLHGTEVTITGKTRWETTYLQNISHHGRGAKTAHHWCC